MKKGLIILIVFSVVLALILGFSGIFKKEGISQTVLQVQATNTEYVVKDDSGNVIPNNSEIVIGDSYTISLVENPEYELKTFKINGTSVLEKLENNQYTFTCNGTTMVTIISAVIVPGGEVISNYSINFIKIKHPSALSMLNWSELPDIDLMVYDAYGNPLAQLDEGESFRPNENESYVVNAVFNNCTYNSNVKCYLGFSYAGFLPYNITNISQNFDISVEYDFLRITFTGINDYATEAGVAIKVVDVGGNPTSDLVLGEQYTIIDTCNPGYEAVVKVNNEQVTLPHTFTYTEDVELDITAEKIKVVPDMQIYMAGYTLNDTLGNPVTELVYGETYTLSIVPDYCCEFTELQFNGISVYENPYTFTFTDTYASFYCFCNYSNLPYSVSAENCSYYFMDVVGNYPTELKLGTIYTLYANPVDGYSITSATLNGMEISLPYEFSCNSPGETYNFVIYTQETVSNIIPSVNLPYHTYTFKDVNNNVVTELIPGQTYDFIAYNEYGYYINNLYLNNEILVHSFNNWLDDNGLLTERIYTFIATEEIIITSEVLMNSIMPNCDGLGSWRFQDVETLEYTYELYYLKTYIATFEPEVNYVLTSAKHNGEDISLPYTFTPTSPCSFEATTEYVEPVDNTVSITLNYDSSMCSAYITDINGNTVNEYAQNTDYIIVVNPLNGYEVSSIIWQPGIELTNNSVFNTGSTESIPIFITCTPFTFTPEVSAENCYYSFTDSNGNTTTTLTYGETFTISGGGNYGYGTPMLTINNSGMYDLPYTFTVNELPFTFQLTTSPVCVIYSDIVEATNCTYEFTPNSGNVLVYGTEYTLTAIANSGYTISTVEYMGEPHALPYTFTFNNLTEKFVLNAVEMPSTVSIKVQANGLLFAETDYSHGAYFYQNLNDSNLNYGADLGFYALSLGKTYSGDLTSYLDNYSYFIYYFELPEGTRYVSATLNGEPINISFNEDLYCYATDKISLLQENISLIITLESAS